MDLRAFKHRVSLVTAFAILIYESSKPEVTKFVDRKGAAAQQGVLIRGGLGKLRTMGATPEAIMKKEKSYSLLTAVQASLKKVALLAEELTRLSSSLPIQFQADPKLQLQVVPLKDDDRQLYQGCVEVRAATLAGACKDIAARITGVTRDCSATSWKASLDKDATFKSVMDQAQQTLLKLDGSAMRDHFNAYEKAMLLHWFLRLRALWPW